MLREEVGSLQTQLLRHQEEIEELTALYESEKCQNSALEEAASAEKQNFNKVTSAVMLILSSRYYVQP